MKYFFISMRVNKEVFTYGPYKTIDEAISFLVNDVPSISKHIASKKRFRYKAEIQECRLRDTWETISIPVIETECTRLC